MKIFFLMFDTHVLDAEAWLLPTKRNVKIKALYFYPLPNSSIDLSQD